MGATFKKMENYDNEEYGGHFYAILLRKGAVKANKRSIFDMPVLAVFIGFKGQEGMTFQGLKIT